MHSDGRASEEAAVLTGRLVANADAMVQRVIARIVEEIPAYTLGTPSEDDLRRSVDHNVRSILDTMAGGRPRLEAPQETGQQRADQRFALADVLQAFRLGGRVIWDELTEVGRALGSGAEAQLSVGAALWTAIDGHSTMVSTAYHERELSIVRRDAERMAAAFDQLVTTPELSMAELDRLAAELGVARDGAFVLLSLDPHTNPSPHRRWIETAVVGLAGRAVFRQDAVRHLGLVQVGTMHDVETIVAGLARSVPGTVGVGTPYVDLATTTVAIRQAELARLSGDDALTRYGDHPLRQVLAAAPSHAEDAASAILGHLLADELLLSTLATWVSVGGSTAECAAHLHCHRNTLTNRLQGIARLTGRDPSTPRGAAELVLALEALGLASRAERSQPSR